MQDEHHLKLTDATWFERVATITLIVCIAAIGCFPNWINETIQHSFTPIIEVINQAANSGAMASVM